MEQFESRCTPTTYAVQRVAVSVRCVAPHFDNRGSMGPPGGPAVMGFSHSPISLQTAEIVVQEPLRQPTTIRPFYSRSFLSAPLENEDEPLVRSVTGKAQEWIKIRRRLGSSAKKSNSVPSRLSVIGNRCISLEAKRLDDIDARGAGGRQPRRDDRSR
jgi:hypothetical protein